MSVWETIAIYALLPAAIIAVLALLTMVPGRHRAKVHYKPGQPWNYPDQFWAGVAPVASTPVDDRVGTKRGGAHGTW